MRGYSNQRPNPDYENLDMRSILRDIAKAWWMILLIALSAVMLTYAAISFWHKPEYTISTTFVVSGKNADSNIYSNLSSAYEMAQKFSAVLENNILKKKVMEDLQMSSFDAKLSAAIVPESNMMDLSVTADTPQKAFLILRSVLENYPSISDYILPSVVLETLRQPDISSVPSNQIPVRKYMIYAGLLAAGIMMALIAITSYFRDTVKNEAEFVKKVDSDLLGTVYHEKKRKKNMNMLISNPMLSFRYVECYRMLAARIKGRMDKREAKVLMVTSVIENEGKSTAASNIALALSQDQKNVLLMDCDFRKPALYKIFDSSGKNAKDFSDVIRGTETADGVMKRLQFLRLYGIFSYHSVSNSTEVVSNGILKKIIGICRKKMDYIVLDTPPMGLVADAEEIIRLADAAILVIRQDNVNTRDINDAIDALNQEEEKVIGCVYSNVQPRLGTRMSKGHYGYGGYGNYSKADR